MDSGLLRNDVDALIDDRPADKVFRVDRSIYTDPDLFELEMERIFESTWQFLCHESQVETPGDYFWNHIGRQPVLVWRQNDGTLKGFINACMHRAAVLTPFKQANAKTLTCRFHGWTYANDGRCLKMRNEESGFAPGKLDRTPFGLRPLSRLESYRGFVFGSLNPDVQALPEFLGAAAKFVDFIADQSAAGMQVLPGSQTYIIHGNWKLQAENATDGYHTGTVHRVFANTMKTREDRDGLTGMMRTEAGRITGDARNGCYDFGGGHMAIWADRAPPETSPLWEAKEKLERAHPPGKVKWLLMRGRNLVIFPNLMINDFAATQIRTFRPLAVDRTEVTIYCIAPKDESKAARYARLRKFEDFFMVTGMATSDDVVALEDSQAGNHSRMRPWCEFHRGMHSVVHGPDADAKLGDFAPETSNNTWDQETVYHSFYRTWRHMLSRKSRV